MIYGYARVSTRKQKLDRQVRNILAKYPDAEIIEETYTGTKYYGRKELERLIKKIRPGDTIVVDEVSRLSRNEDEGVALYTDLYEQGVNLVFLKEPQLNTDTYKAAMNATLDMTFDTGDDAADGLMSDMIAAINRYTLRLADEQIRLAFRQAQAEVDYLHKRVSEGLREAKAAGKQIGTPSGTRYITKKSIEAKAKIKKYSRAFDGDLNDRDTIKLIAINRDTYYKYKRELLAENSET